ncbi:SAVED domain-containing protein [Bradyrhizobium sp. 4]|uniref:SAVED domain-containing protein n=1 Tax=unclassified Bradyrhizobium TaxID=2631580 RepID=UPI001FFB9AF9|nr:MULTISPECIES: SAVED domain-containing protein [unclassified Bradyrhizobium]MCK1402700.1 SAVED domain-containing protein [Bradyrhizobium sp. 39]MCK1748295.1 SAVED domain-containing protein [Bradyrhizobium sp. 135]UPJ32773.1 SAVED domain-containing protein [Bradyrhizobium sp. 4]
MGGIIAQDGFDYQLWDGLIRLPAWLADPAFEELIFEGLEDLEARFFAPQAPRGRLLERYQAKGGTLSPAEVREVLEGFLAFETVYPEAARVHALVTPRMPPTVSWLARDPNRVRNARPFYAPFADIAAASDNELRQRLLTSYGGELGAFVAAAVEVSERNLPELDAAVAQFDTKLTRTFPSLDASRRRVADAFAALSELARRSIGVPLSANLLTRTIEQALGTNLGLPTVFPLHIRSDKNEEDAHALQIDAAAFSGGSGEFPDRSGWSALTAALDTTSRWLQSRGTSRIRLSGSYRLTTAFLIGWKFRSAIGFELDIPMRSGNWSTDQHPLPGPGLPWKIKSPSALVAGRLVVGIGILRDPASEIVRQLQLADEQNVLLAQLPQALSNGIEVQSSLQIVKSAITEAVGRLHPQAIDIYYVGPAAFAVALGHRWNGFPVTQLNEFLQAHRKYVATASTD